MLLHLFLLSAVAVFPSNAPTSVPGQGVVPTGITRQAGTDPGSGIQYVLLSSSGKRLSSASADSPPQLTAQCSLGSPGKYKFELLTDFGNAASPLVFAAPWRPNPGELFPPNLEPVRNLT